MGKRHKHKSSKSDKRRRGEGLDDVELPSTSGALGNEKPKKRERPTKDDLVGKSRKDRDAVPNAPTAANVLPAHSEAPLPSISNLAGAPELAIRSWRGAKNVERATCYPWVNINLNAESNIHFLLNTGAYEWVHLDRDSVSLVLYTTYKQPAGQWHPNEAAVVNGQPNPNHYEYHSVRRAAANHLMMDPDIGARGLFNRVEVIINDQLVPTNSSLGPLFVHYSRIAAIFRNEDAKERLPHFLVSTDFTYDQQNEESHVMHAATEPFAHTAWNDHEGRRTVVPLDGIFPFDLKSSLHVSIEKQLPPVLFIPPATKFELKLYFYPTRMETVFPNEIINDDWYYNLAGHDAAAWNLTPSKQTIQSAEMSYLSVEMFPTVHADTMTKYRGKADAGKWDFDIPRGQHQALTANVSFTENTFQIYAYCRSFIIAFVPDHAAFVQAHTKRPLSAWSTFPANATKIHINYAGVALGGPYVNFGVAPKQSERTKDLYYRYLSGLNLAGNFTFRHMFPEDPDVRSYVQYFAFDVRHLMLEKFQTLRISCEFANNVASPAGWQVLVFSIHPNGHARVSNLSATGTDYLWEFLQAN